MAKTKESSGGQTQCLTGVQPQCRSGGQFFLDDDGNVLSHTFTQPHKPAEEDAESQTGPIDSSDDTPQEVSDAD